MKYFKNFFNQQDIPINPVFENMTQEELLRLIYSLKEVNDKQKENLNKLSEENEDLKDSILNKKKNNSEIKNIYNDLKYTLFSSNEIEINEKNKDFNDFLYDQYLLYDGLEEEEVNDLNQIKKIDDYLENNKELFIFKQKIIERNYQELFRNIEASKQLQKLFPTKKENIINDIIIEDKKIEKEKEKNVIKDRGIEDNMIEKESNIIKGNNNEVKKNKNENKKEVKDIKKSSLSDKKLEGKKKHKKKEKENEEKKKELNNIIQNKMNIESLNPIKKKEEKNNFLDNLLNDDDNDDNNEISFKDINTNNKRWEEDQ